MTVSAIKHLALAVTIMAGASVALAEGSSAPARAPSTKTAVQIKAPGAPKPDLEIINQGRVGGTDNKLMVQVRNNGADNPQGVLVQGLNYGPGGGGATGLLPPIKAGQTAWATLVFNVAPQDGARMKLMVDYNNQVAESNENNNQKAFNW